MCHTWPKSLINDENHCTPHRECRDLKCMFTIDKLAQLCLSKDNYTRNCWSTNKPDDASQGNIKTGGTRCKPWWHSWQLLWCHHLFHLMIRVLALLLHLDTSILCLAINCTPLQLRRRQEWGGSQCSRQARKTDGASKSWLKTQALCHDRHKACICLLQSPMQRIVLLMMVVARPP